MIGTDPSGVSHNVTWIDFELVFLPWSRNILCRLYNQFISKVIYSSESSICVYETEWIKGGVHELSLGQKILHNGNAQFCNERKNKKVTIFRTSVAGLGVAEAIDATTKGEKYRAKKASSKQRNAGT